MIGNETKLNESLAEYEARKNEYFESIFSLNTTLKEIIRVRKENKTKEIRDKFNMTIEGDFLFFYFFHQLLINHRMISFYFRRVFGICSKNFSGKKG